MLSLETRSDLLVQAAELNSNSLFAELIDLLATVDRAALLGEPELAFFLAHAFYRRERHDEALKLLETLVEPSKRAGRNRLFRRRLNLEGVILLDRGRIDAAEQIFLEVQGAATAAGDREYLGYCALNLGTISSIRGEWFRATATLQRAITAFQEMGRTYGLAACHQNIAITFSELGFFDDAESHLDQASELFSAISENLHLEIASTDIQRGLVVLLAGDAPQAEELVNRAIYRLELGTRGHPANRHEGEALRVRGMSSLALGRLSDAREFLMDALGRAMTAGDLLLQAEIYEVLSVLEHAAEDDESSKVWSEKAVRAYVSLGAMQRAGRVEQAITRFPH